MLKNSLILKRCIGSTEDNKFSYVFPNSKGKVINKIAEIAPFTLNLQNLPENFLFMVYRIKSIWICLSSFSCSFLTLINVKTLPGTQISVVGGIQPPVGSSLTYKNLRRLEAYGSYTLVALRGGGDSRYGSYGGTCTPKLWFVFAST